MTGARMGRDLEDGTGALVVPALLGLAVAGVLELAIFVVVASVALTTSDLSVRFGTADTVRMSVAGAAGLGIACAAGAWVCGRRCRIRDIGARRARRAAVITGCLAAALALLLGMGLALRWETLPIYLVLVSAGIWLGAVRGSA